MKKILVFMGVFLLYLVSAQSMTSGETFVVELSEPYEYYSIVGNESPLDIKVSQEGLIVSIEIGKYNPSDSFDLIFFNKEKEVITEHHYSSGGGGSRRTIIKEVKGEDKWTNTTTIVKELCDETCDEKIDVPIQRSWLSKYWLLLLLPIIILAIYILVKTIRKEED